MRATKDSGVDWLGEIPADWDVSRLKRVFRRVKRELAPDLGIVTAFRDGQVTLRSNRRSEGFTEADDYSNYQRIEPNDLAIHAMDAFAGAIGVCDSAGMCSPVLSVCSPLEGSEPRYMAYVLRTMANRGWIEALSKSIRERTSEFRWAEAGAQHVPIPPSDEQRRIADFLERETAKIDALISKQEQLITTLDERRQALIMRAVTEGLDPEAPLRTEETIWFKRIPSHWNAGPLKRFAEVTLGKMVSSDKPEGDGLELPYLRAASVQPLGQIDFDDSKRMGFSLREREKFGLQKNDVVVVEGGSIGRSALIAEDLENWGYQNSINRVRAMRHVTGAFLNWSLQALESSGVYSMMTNVSTIAHLTAEKLKTVPLAVPPPEEQEEICFHLESITQELDRLAETSRLTIALLQERRKALISAAVTGKLEVNV